MTSETFIQPINSEETPCPYPLATFYERQASFEAKMKEQEKLWEREKYLRMGIDIDEWRITVESTELVPNESLEINPKRSIPSRQL